MPDRAPGTTIPILTLTTDFGLRDHYVASMKGAILSVNPDVRIVDITHEIPPQNIVEAGFTLACAFPTFPAGSIHVLVVDPGVGTDRRLILARTDNHVFLAPDNGSLGIVFDREALREAFQITASHYFRPREGATFDGRDILAPVAAWISRGTALSHFGERIHDYAPAPLPAPGPAADGRVALRVLHVDRFGNVILNLKRPAFEERLRTSGENRFRLEVAGREISRLLNAYGESTSEEPFALFNSCGYLELAVRNGSAAATLSASPGQLCLLEL